MTRLAILVALAALAGNAGAHTDDERQVYDQGYEDGKHAAYWAGHSLILRHHSKKFNYRTKGPHGYMGGIAEQLAVMLWKGKVKEILSSDTTIRFCDKVNLGGWEDFDAKTYLLRERYVVVPEVLISGQA